MDSNSECVARYNFVPLFHGKLPSSRMTLVNITNSLAIEEASGRGMVVAVNRLERPGSKAMKNTLKVAILLAPLATPSAFAQSGEADPYQEWVDVKNGEVSVAFNQTPVRFALDAFHAKTGFTIVVPPSTDAKTVNLRLDRQPFEPAVRSLISTIGYQNFAMVYDQQGRPHSAVVLGAQPPAFKNSTAAPPVAPLTIEERDRLKKEIDRWNELKQEERSRIEDRLRNLPPSEDREILVREYGRQVLALK